MSVIKNLFEGSFFSDDNLLQGRDGYAPGVAGPGAESAYAHWARRITTSNELGIAREMAGLPEETLAGLASVFADQPRRKRTDKLRHSIPVGVALLLAGAAALLFDVTVLSSGGSGVSLLRTLAIVALASGFVGVGVGTLIAFNMMPLDIAHGKLGLCTAPLDEHHPWLYRASLATRDSGADEYRKRILSQRGSLRGIDYLMMREIAQAGEALQMTRVARAVAADLNLPDAAPAPSPSGQVKEPRLVSVPL